MARWRSRGVASSDGDGPRPERADGLSGEPRMVKGSSVVPNAIVAATQRIQPTIWGNIRLPRSVWQQEAWRQYDINGELNFGCRWLGAALSRCRLIAVEVGPTGQILGAVDDPQINAIVAGFAGAPGKQATMMMQFGPQLTVAGDCYVLATVGTNGAFETWCVHSTEEVRTYSDTQIVIDTGDGFPKIYNLADVLLFRVYRPHPRRSWEADSPTRAALPVLREMEQLTKHIFATIDSRLAGAGILLLPSELDFATPQDEIQPGETPFMALLSEAMMASIKDRGDARAVVPIVVQGPKDAIGSATWLTSPAADLTVYASDLREKAIRRLALDLDMPPEVLLGVSGSNHWGQWAIEEQGIKLHIEPVMMIICSAITESYFKAALEASGLDSSKYAIWFDPSELILRPNRAQDAKDLYDKGEISGAVLRRETGFSEQDAPQGKDKALLELYKLINLSPRAGDALLPIFLALIDITQFGVTPEQLQQVINAQGVDGTPAVPPAPAPPNKDPNAPPVPGANGNSG